MSGHSKKKYIKGEEPVIEETPPAVEAAAKAANIDAVFEAPVTASLKELESALESNPSFYETLFTSEVERVGGPRKGAMRLFLAHETVSENREDRLIEIHELLG